jgi:hypothetical protein
LRWAFLLGAGDDLEFEVSKRKCACWSASEILHQNPIGLLAPNKQENESWGDREAAVNAPALADQSAAKR